MKTLVTVKRTVDPYAKIKVKGDKTGIETVKMSMNPFDEIALEEAIRAKEKNIITEVVVVSIGNMQCQETLRQALALGADRAIHINTENAYCSANIAQILCYIAKREAPQLILMGKQAIDSDSNQTPQMLSALLGIPQATYASCIEFINNKVQVTREIDTGLETLELTLPAVISVDLRLNKPRYATLPNIMKAKTKPLECIALNDLKLNLKEHVKVLSIEAPAPRAPGIKLDSVESLIQKLHYEDKVL